MKKIFFIIIFSIVLGGMVVEMVPAAEVRPIKVKVVDKETSAPVNGVVIYYALETVKVEKILGFIPALGGSIFRYRIIESYTTDSDGTIIIPKRKINLELYEQLSSEEICVNLDIKDKFIRYKEYPEEKDIFQQGNSKEKSFIRLFNIHDIENVEKFYNPIEIYRGFVIYNGYTDVDANKMGGTKRQKFDVLWNSRSFKKKSESFVVELEKNEIGNAPQKINQP